MLIRSEKAAEAEIEYKEVRVFVSFGKLEFIYCKNLSSFTWEARAYLL